VEPGETCAAIQHAMDRADELLAHARSGRVIREGAQVVLVGRPNVGKSSLFNRFVGFDRAIITEHPGTTRDLVTERVEVGGVPLLVVDTAGLRDVIEPIEQAGVARARGALASSEVVILVLDRSEPLTSDDRQLLAETSAATRVLVVNKTDLPACWAASELDVEAVEVSAAADVGVDEVRKAVLRKLGAATVPRDAAVITNLRHQTLVERSREALGRAAASARDGASEEFVLADLREALDALQEVSGARTPDGLLEEIFSRFCIGK
jgi:tRNA modification GTPase